MVGLAGFDFIYSGVLLPIFLNPSFVSRVPPREYGVLLGRVATLQCAVLPELRLGSTRSFSLRSRGLIYKDETNRTYALEVQNQAYSVL